MKNKFALRLFAFLSAMLVSVPAFAQAQSGTIGASAEKVFGQLTSFADLATSAAFLMGIGFGIMALVKFKAYGDDPRSNKIHTPIILMVVAAGLIGLPAFLSMTSKSVGLKPDGSLNSSVYDQIK